MKGVSVFTASIMFTCAGIFWNLLLKPDWDRLIQESIFLLTFNVLYWVLNYKKEKTIGAFTTKTLAIDNKIVVVYSEDGEIKTRIFEVKGGE